MPDSLYLFIACTDAVAIPMMAIHTITGLRTCFVNFLMCFVPNFFFGGNYNDPLFILTDNKQQVKEFFLDVQVWDCNVVWISACHRIFSLYKTVHAVISNFVTLLGGDYC